jgi:hypothetical protein
LSSHNANSGVSFKQFLAGELSIKDKSSPEYGAIVSKYIQDTIQSGWSGYYFSRNNRFRDNRNAANGREVMQKFMDLLEINGKTNYVNINWDSIKIYNRIISGLVGRWMNYGEKINVTAIDPLSVTQKKKEADAVEFIVANKREIAALEAEAGMQLTPKGETLPEDMEEFNLWVQQIQRLPEELRYQIGINDVLASNGFFDTMKERLLRDSAEVGFVGTYTWMDEEGVIHVDWVRPENALYSYSEFDDFRDTTWRGQIRAMKISELRRKYGKEFGGFLTEEQIYEIASNAKEFQLSDKILWVNNFNFMYVRPYDEYNIDVIDFEIKTVDSQPYTVVTTKKNKSTILKKGSKPKVDENEKIIADTKYNIYRGVFVRNNNFMLEWGLKKNMVRPQDPKELGNAEFSYSFFMYQNYEMRNIAVPEKIKEPAEQMILARLKMQQLIAKMKPAGAAYNVDAIQQLELGLSTGKASPVEVNRIYEQTGNFYYRGTDAEGRPLPIPVTELPNNGFAGQMQTLINTYQMHYQVLKDELGEDPNLISQALQPRVSTGNVDTAKEASANATDYMYFAVRRVLEDTARKVSCLLKNSVEYGSNAYRKMVGVNDVQGRIFGTKIEMMPNQNDIMRFEQSMNQMIAANPDMLLFIDPFKLIRIAKEDVKLAEELFRQGQKKMLLDRQRQAQQNAELNAKAQQESIKIKAEADAALIQQEVELKSQLEEKISETKLKETMVSSIFSLYGKGVELPTELKELATQVITNVGIPLFMKNVEAETELQEQMQAMKEQEEDEQFQASRLAGGSEQPEMQPEEEEIEEEEVIEEPYETES